MLTAQSKVILNAGAVLRLQGSRKRNVPLRFVHCDRPPGHDSQYIANTMMTIVLPLAWENSACGALGIVVVAVVVEDDVVDSSVCSLLAKKTKRAGR